MSKTMRQIFGEALIHFADEFSNMVVLDADVSSSTQTKLFRTQYSDRFYNFGIAEGNMAAAAAGMAACGKISVISSFAFLLSMRAMDCVHSLAAYNNLNVKICGGYSGLSDFADGASHQSICDIAMMRALPNMRILAPSDEESTIGAVHEMLAHNGPVYLRLSRDNVGNLHNGHAGIRFGKANLLYEGRDALIITTGTMLTVAIEARKLLQMRGINIAILEAISIKPLDIEVICELSAQIKRVITLEEHSVIGGLGEAVCAAVCGRNPVSVYRIGIEDTFGQSARNYSQLLSAYGLDANSIARKIEELIKV